jgi:hypothetical protein
MTRSAPIRDVLVHGIIGGLIAGLVVSVWFFVIDAIAGQLFTTPAILGQAIMQLPEFAMTPRLLFGYTVLHLGVFVGLGIATAWFVRVTRLAPSLLLGLGFGIVTLDVVYYGGLLVTGASMLEVIEWYQVVPANALAGMALMGYLHRATRESQPLGWGVLRGHPQLTEGIMTGLCGAAVVALWFLLVDTVTARPFHTPAALASALFLGAQSEAEIHMSLGLIAGYTVLHVAVFAVAGFVLAAAATYLERAPSRALVVVLSLMLLEAVVLATLLLGASWVLGSVGLWAITAANALAVLAMFWFLLRTHRTLPERLRHATVDP